jgi:transcriptional regulator with XRE-family HTH domain
MPVPDFLRLELRHYMIGQKLKALRLRRSMGLLQLGQRTGLSPALLSKIETGKLVPTVPTLLRVAMVFDVPLEHFFRNEHRHRVISITRKDEWKCNRSKSLAPDHGCELTSLDLGPGERKFQTYYAEFPASPDGGARLHLHQGFEFIHVLTGSLRLIIGGDEMVLHCGDSIYFDSGLQHAYSRVSDEPCTALMVLARPDWNSSERRMDRLEAIRTIRRRNKTEPSSPPEQPEILQNNRQPQAKDSLQDSA